MRKLLLGTLLGTTLLVGARAQDVDAPVTADPPTKGELVVHAKPPRAVKEHPPASPAPGDVWIGGYQEWDGNKFVWQPGHWEKPPHEQAIWMAPRWERRGHDYVFMDGWWE
jgi:hypothetical protein